MGMVEEQQPTQVEPEVATGAKGSSEPGAHVLLIALLLLLLIQLVAWVRTTPPAALPADAPPEVFSAGRAFATLERILGAEPRPHPVGSPANDAVRGRLLAELEKLGLETEVQEAFHCSQRYASSGLVRNVLARLPGAAEGKALLLVAHYDSVAAGPGAGDDMSGVVTLLEIARILKAGAPPARPLLFLFSDGEEAGLLGADAFVAEHPWFAQVDTVINIEARGSRGPSLMFETGPNNAEIVNRFARAAGRPVTASTFSSVYERMPNNTDFTPFKEQGLPGINVSFIGSVPHYHTALDDPDHLDRRSIQHHGENLLPLVRDLLANPLQGAEGNAVFFDLFGLTVVRWPAGITPLLSLAALLLVGLSIVLPARGERGRRELRRLGWGLLSVVLGLVLAWTVCYLLARLTRPPVPWPAHPGAYVVMLGAAALTVLAVVATGLAERTRYWGAWSAVWLVWSGVALGLSFGLAGFSFLFLVPALLAGVLGLPARLLPKSRALAGLAGVVPLLAAGCLFLPMLRLMYDALGVGPALWTPTAYLFALFLTSLVPLLALHDTTHHGVAVLFVALGLLFVSGVAATNSQTYTADPLRAAGKPPAQGRPYASDVPRRVTYAFHQDTTENKAQWLLFTPGTSLPEFLLSAPQQFSGERSRPLPFWPGAFRAEASLIPKVAPPRLADLKTVPSEGGRRITARLVSPRKARHGALLLAPQAKITSIKLQGKPAKVFRVGKAKARWAVFWCHTLPAEGLLIELELEGTKPVEALLVDGEIGLPESGQLLQDLRGFLATPSGHPLRADMWIHTAKVELQ